MDTSETKEIENNEVTYRVTLRVKDTTDDPIDSLTLSLRGDLSTADKLLLNASNKVNSEDLFQKDTTNEFEIAALNVGQVKSIEIGHDHDDRGIFIDTINVKNSDSEFKFTINNWLDSTRNKKIIQVETDSAAQKRKTSVEAEPSKKEVVVPPANNATKSDDIPKRKSISKQNSKSSQEEEQTTPKKDSIEQPKLDSESFTLLNSNAQQQEQQQDESRLNEPDDTQQNTARLSESSSSSSSSSDESEHKPNKDSPRSSAHSPMLRKKSIISTTETNKSKTSLRSKQTTSSLSVKSPLPPLTPKRQSRQSLDVDKQISRLAQKSQQSHHSITRSKISLRSNSHHSVSPKRESKLDQNEKINKSKISLRSNKSNLSARSAKQSRSPASSTSPSPRLNESKKSTSKLEKKKQSSADRSDSKLSSTSHKSESKNNTHRSSHAEKKPSLRSIKSKHSISKSESARSLTVSHQSSSLLLTKRDKNNEDITTTKHQTTSHSSRRRSTSSSSSSRSTKRSTNKIPNEFIQSTRSSSHSSSRSSSSSSSSTHKSVALPTPYKPAKSRSSSRQSDNIITPKKSLELPDTHKRNRPSARSSRSNSSGSSSSSTSSKQQHSKRSSSSSNRSEKRSVQISIPSLQKSTSTIRSSITESEILLSQSYFEDADRVVQDILLRSELSEKKKKANNLNEGAAAAAAATSSSFNNTKTKPSKAPTTNLNSNKQLSSRNQNTKSDFNANSDSLTRFARMEKRAKYKPNVNPDLQEESTHIELKRIKDALIKETSKIVCPKRKDHVPFVFNDLTPYADTRHVDYLINSPLNNQPIGYYNRYTAMTIVEPWVAHRMEHTVGPLFSKSIRHSSVPRSQIICDKLRDRPSKDQIEGSTLAPEFPKLVIKKPKGMNGPFYYDDIEIIRKELEKNLKNKTRFEADRNRTINDYYRMNLDHSVDTEKTWETFRAYLENTPGSKQALKEIMTKTKQTDSVA